MVVHQLKVTYLMNYTFYSSFFFCFKLGQFQVENISNAIC